MWFEGTKGYGFIRPADPSVNQGKDLFVHYHNIVQRGSYKSLQKDDKVEFFVGENPRGPCADEVKITVSAGKPPVMGSDDSGNR